MKIYSDARRMEEISPAVLAKYKCHHPIFEGMKFHEDLFRSQVSEIYKEYTKLGDKVTKNHRLCEAYNTNDIFDMSEESFIKFPEK